mmetsp:Transcript_18037/g.38932  ORF Transcript_18037/g.38932 Transcript_18037/m.38932 type:complete len:94 (-) Transcript_18037:1776-2057(-)
MLGWIYWILPRCIIALHSQNRLTVPATIYLFTMAACTSFPLLTKIRTRQRGETTSNSPLIYTTKLGTKQEASILVMHNFSIMSCNDCSKASKL